MRAALYMSVLVATRSNTVIRTFYQRLLAAGTPKKLALVACRRKLLTILNAMLRTETAWRQTGAALTQDRKSLPLMLDDLPVCH